MADTFTEDDFANVAEICEREANACEYIGWPKEIEAESRRRAAMFRHAAALARAVGEAEELANCADALYLVKTGQNTGMGENIVGEKAAKTLAQIRHFRRALPSPPPAQEQP